MLRNTLLTPVLGHPTGNFEHINLPVKVNRKMTTDL